MDLILKYHLGEIASILGIIFSIVSFIIIIVNVNKNKQISQQVRNDILKFDTLSDFSNAMSCMEEIKRLHRKEAWDLLPERYSSLKKSLIAIRTSCPNMPDEHKKKIQSAIQTFSSLEIEMDTALIKKTPPPDAAVANKIITRHIDKLQPILVDIRNDIGR